MSMASGNDNAALDPITVEVIANKLDGIANEMEQTLLQSSFSPIVKEGLDASASLFTLQGETLAQAIGIPLHLATLIPIVNKFIETFPIATMKEGDLYVMNDPYLGGTHLPDIGVVAPIFHQGRPIAFGATMTHHQDVGGMTPGSVPTNATEIFQEGIRIPPLKLRDGDTMNETFIAMMRQNVRIPDSFMGDLNAQIAACSVSTRRMRELADAYGGNFLSAVFERLLDDAEMLTREGLRKIPEGTYRYSDALDNDGVEFDKRVPIEVAVTIRDGTFEVDFEGTSAQVKGPFNAVPSSSHAAAYFAIRALTDPNIHTNGGCFRPVSLRLPEGSLVNPRSPAPVNARTITIKRITGCVLGALKDIVPERVPADSGNELLTVMFGGHHAEGKAYVIGDLIASGSGASMYKDGVDVIETDASNCMNLPAEALELEGPIRVNQVALRRDSGGPGKHRGGLGILREYEILEGEVTLTYRGDRFKSPPAGAAGGGSGATANGVIHRLGGGTEAIPSKLVGTLRKGDRLVVETPGGGGYGDPRERDPDRLNADVANGKVSAASAVRDYGG